MPVKPVVILDPHRRTLHEIFSPDDIARLHDLAEVVWGRDEPMPTVEFATALKHAEAVVVGQWRHGDILDADHAPKVGAILEVSGGFPRELDYGALLNRGVRVLCCAPAFGPQVAEMALAMALAACRGVVSADRAFRAGEEIWLQASNRDSFLLYGKPVGFIGYGGLAQCLRPLLAPFGCPISVYDPWLGQGYLASQGVCPVSLETLLDTTRVIFVLAVPSAENQALLSREMLERIQPGSVLVLVSRAHVVDFDALTDLVLAGRFRAAIDVFPSEPFPSDHPIRQAPNVILSAHRAGSVPEGLTEIGRYVVDDLEAVLRGLPPRRMQAAQPELAYRYAGNRVPLPK